MKTYPNAAMDNVSLESTESLGLVNPSTHGSSVSGSLSAREFDPECSSLMSTEECVEESSLCGSPFQARSVTPRKRSSFSTSNIRSDSQWPRDRFSSLERFLSEEHDTKMAPKYSSMGDNYYENGSNKPSRLFLAGIRREKCSSGCDLFCSHDSDNFEEEIRNSTTEEQSSFDVTKEFDVNLDLFHSPPKSKVPTNSTNSPTSSKSDDDFFSSRSSDRRQNVPVSIQWNKYFPFLIAALAHLPLIIFQISQIMVVNKKDECIYQVSSEIQRLYKEIQFIRFNFDNKSQGMEWILKQPFNFLSTDETDQTASNFLFNSFGMAVCITSCLFISCYVIRQMKLDVENLHKNVTKMQERSDLRESSVFMVELTHQGNLTTPPRQRLDTFVRFMTHCDHYDKIQRHYVVPREGSYYLCACLMQHRSAECGELDLHVCTGLGDRRWLGRSNKQTSFVNGSTM